MNLSRPYSLTRDEYKRIKNFNKDQMELFLSELYVEAHNTGVDTIASNMTPIIVDSIKATKGIGHTRSEQLQKNISARMAEAYKYDD